MYADLRLARPTGWSAAVAAPGIGRVDQPAQAAVHGAPRSAQRDLHWDLLIIALAGYVLTAVGRIHQLFPAVGFMHPAILTAAAAIGLYMADSSLERRSRLIRVRTSRYLVVLFAWMAIAVPTALVRGTSLGAVESFAKTLVMVFVMAAAVRGFRDVERLGGAYLLAATTYAIVVLTRFDLSDTSQWRLGKLYYYDANDFATFAVTAMPFGLYFLASGRRAIVRLFGGAALALLAMAFVRSGSRGGFIAILAVAVFVVVRYTGIPFRWRMAGTALVALVVVGAAGHEYWSQMGTILSDADYNRTEEGGRLQIWQRGIGYVMQYPLLGVGAENFPAAEGMISPLAKRQEYGKPVRWSAPHNSYLQVAAELGIPGLLIFLLLLRSAFKAMQRVARPLPIAPRRPPDPGGVSPQELARTLTAALIGFCVGAFFLSLAYHDLLYVLLAMTIALQKSFASQPSIVSSATTRSFVASGFSRTTRPLPARS